MKKSTTNPGRRHGTYDFVVWHQPRNQTTSVRLLDYDRAMRRYIIHITLHKTDNYLSSSDDDNAFIPAFLFQQLPAQKAKPTTRKRSASISSHKDYRFGHICIDWMDFEDMSKATYSGSGKGRGVYYTSRMTCPQNLIPNKVRQRPSLCHTLVSSPDPRTFLRERYMYFESCQRYHQMRNSKRLIRPYSTNATSHLA